MNEIQQWLINIQARAPNSPVIIVGTHLDEVKVIYRLWYWKLVILLDFPGIPIVNYYLIGPKSL
jgi:hypothetical protein